MPYLLRPPPTGWVNLSVPWTPPGAGVAGITNGIQLTKAMVGHTAYYDVSLGRLLTDSDLTSGPTQSSAANQVIYAKHIAGGFDQQHDNVTLRGCWVEGEIATNGFTGLLLDYVEVGLRGTVNGNGTYSCGVSWSGYTANRVYVHNFSDGFHPNGNCNVIESLVDGQEFTPVTDHHDSFQITEGSNIQIVRCSAFNNNGETSAYQIGADQGPIDNVLMKDIYGKIAWGSDSGYTFYEGNGSGCTNIFWEGAIADSWLGDAHALHGDTPASGHLIGCSYSDGTLIPDEHWGGL